jgi:hypothetical protein
MSFQGLDEQDLFFAPYSLLLEDRLNKQMNTTCSWRLTLFGSRSQICVRA